MDVDERDDKKEQDGIGRNTEPAETVCTHTHKSF